MTSSSQNQHSETKAEKDEAKAQAHAQAEAAKAEAKAKHDTEARTKANRDAIAARAKEAKAKRGKMPTGGTIIAAGSGYTVLTAVLEGDPPALKFPPALIVIAWSIGADGTAWPITAVPVSENAIDVGTVHTNGAVVDLDGTVHAGPVEWQAAVKAREAGAEPVAPPVNATAPYLSQTGDLLSCTMGTWADPAPTGYTYAWQKNGAAVAGSTSAEYTITGADVGSTMTCTVTASNALGSTPSVSNAVVVAAQ